MRPKDEQVIADMFAKAKAAAEEGWSLHICLRRGGFNSFNGAYFPFREDPRFQEICDIIRASNPRSNKFLGKPQPRPVGDPFDP